MKSIVIIFIAFILIVINSCIKPDTRECPKEFVLYGEITPYKSAYSLSDTINIDLNLTTNVIEKNLSTFYNLKGMDLSIGFKIYRLDSPKTDVYHGVFEFCDFIKIDSSKFSIYTIENNTSLYSSIKLEKDSTVSISYIPNKKGIYMLSCGVFTNMNKQDFVGACNNNGIDLSTILNKDKDNNFYLLYESPNEFYNTWITSVPSRFYYQKSGFAYKVE